MCGHRDEWDLRSVLSFCGEAGPLPAESMAMHVQSLACRCSISFANSPIDAKAVTVCKIHRNAISNLLNAKNGVFSTIQCAGSGAKTRHPLEMVKKSPQ